MALKLETRVKGNSFRVETQAFSTKWLADTPVNRKVTVVWLRQLVDERGKRLLTLQELAKIVGSENRQAASQHGEDFRACGEEFQAFVMRKRKVNQEVVKAVEKEVMRRPLIGPEELARRVNEQMGREDLTDGNMRGALEQISWARVSGVVRQQLEEGKIRYKEAALMEEMMSSLSSEAGQEAGLEVPARNEGMKVSDPTAVRALVTPDVPLNQISGSVAWVTVMLTLYYWNVPLSVLGRWFKVHKTMVLRWIMGLALALWPVISQWIVERVKASKVYIDEKWIKKRDQEAVSNQG